MNLQAIAAGTMVELASHCRWDYGAAHPKRELELIRCLGSVSESGLLLGQGGSCESEVTQWWSGALN